MPTKIKSLSKKKYKKTKLKPLSKDIQQVVDKQLASLPFVSDDVCHPKHYNFGKIEVIEAIEDWSLDYHRGNAIKYIARAGRKNPQTEIQDLEKAIWYLNRSIACLKSKQLNVPLPKPNKMQK